MSESLIETLLFILFPFLDIFIIFTIAKLLERNQSKWHL